MGNIAAASDIKTRLTIAGSGDDTLIDALIDEVESEIDTELDRTLLETTHTEYAHGTGTDTLWLRNGPISSVTSVNHVSYTDSGGSRSETLDEVTQPNRLEYGLRDDYWKLSSAIVMPGGTFQRGHRNYKVIYVAGWDTSGVPPDGFPEALKQIVIDQVSMRYLSRESNAFASKVLGDGSVSEPMSLEDIQKTLRLQIAPFRSPAVPV